MVQRYDLELKCRGMECSNELVERPDGDYVPYDELAARDEILRRLVEWQETPVALRSEDFMEIYRDARKLVQK